MSVPLTPLELRLKIQRSRKGKLFQAWLDLQEQNLSTEPVRFKPPLESKDRDELRWYLETFPIWPVGPDADRAARLEQNMVVWGRRLFDAVFANPKAIRVWQQFRDRTDRPRLLTLDSIDQEVLRLPWELLADEDGYLFALGIALRRRVEKVQAAPEMRYGLPMRILMVVARPEGTSFIDPRASSRALLDALAPLGPENVVVEFLHPPTLKALSERLSQQPSVHLIHFDGHGVYREQTGLGYLAFEDPDGKLDLADAEQLGQLLRVTLVPMITLGACQSAHADAPDPFSSVAPRLIQAGVGSVVAMQYSVLVETARKFFATFYAALAEGRTVGRALDRGRQALLADTKRHTLYRGDGSTVTLRLRDWFLPALYQQTIDPAPFAQTVHRSVEISDIHRSDVLLGDFPESRYAFTGRSRELWRLERLLRDRRIVVLHGFGGQGKTALVRELAYWLTRKSQFVHALFLSFESGGAADWAVAQMGRLLLGNEFSALSETARLPALRRVLTEESTLIVWDNVESVLRGWHAELPADELQKLLDIGVDLAHMGLTRLVITSRTGELSHKDYNPSQRVAQLELEGLPLDEALQLAGEVLDTLGLPRPERSGLRRLLDYLGGHPLSIQLVLPHLKDYGGDATRMIAEFDKLYPGFTQGKAHERNDSLNVSLSFSLQRLSAATHARLSGLGMFQGGALEAAILRVTGMKPSEWRQVCVDLEQAGLATSEVAIPFEIETEEGMFTGRYVRFHPTLTPYLRRHLSPADRQVLEEHYCQIYYSLSDFLYYANERATQTARITALYELPNLRRALELTLAAGESKTAINFARNVERFLENFGRWHEQKALQRKVQELAKSLHSDTHALMTKIDFTVLFQQADSLLNQGRALDAEHAFRQLLRRLESGLAYSGATAAYDRSITLSQLGRSLASQGRPGDAIDYYRPALAILTDLVRQHPEVYGPIGFLYADLADAFRSQGYYRKAQSYYERSLKIAEETGNERSVAVASTQLGILAYHQKNFLEARGYFQRAREVFQMLGEMCDVEWHWLGMVAQEEAERASGDQRATLLLEAEAAYKESLRLREIRGVPASGADTANQLGQVAFLAGRHADAERWYRRSLDVASAGEALPYLAAALHNLAILLLSIQRMSGGDLPQEFKGRDLMAEAERVAHKAREIRESFKDASNEIWETYGLLAEITEFRGDAQVAKLWRHARRKAFAAFSGHWAQMQPTYGKILQGVVAAVGGDMQALTALETALNAMEGSSRQLVTAIRRLLAGERDWDALSEDLSDHNALFVKKVVEALEHDA